MKGSLIKIIVATLLLVPISGCNEEDVSIVLDNDNECFRYGNSVVKADNPEELSNYYETMLTKREFEKVDDNLEMEKYRVGDKIYNDVLVDGYHALTNYSYISDITILSDDEVHCYVTMFAIKNGGEVDFRFTSFDRNTIEVLVILEDTYEDDKYIYNHVLYGMYNVSDVTFDLIEMKDIEFDIDYNLYDRYTEEYDKFNQYDFTNDEYGISLSALLFMMAYTDELDVLINGES